jgi:hypothetical protein
VTSVTVTNFGSGTANGLFVLLDGGTSAWTLVNSNDTAGY